MFDRVYSGFVWTHTFLEMIVVLVCRKPGLRLNSSPSYYFLHVRTEGHDVRVMV